MNLDKQCAACGSYKWCGRACASDPRDPWDKPAKWEKPMSEVQPQPPKPLPVKKAPKPVVVADKKSGAEKAERISICIPKDVLEAYRSQGRGYQGRINDILRETARKNGWL